MALTNVQYDLIMKEYQIRQYNNEDQLRMKSAKAREKYPRISQIEEELLALRMQQMNNRLREEPKSDAALKEQVEELILEKKALLSMAGFQNGEEEPEYTCPICKDTGYTEGKKCSCFRKREQEILKLHSGLSDILELENFDTFSLKWYPEDMVNPNNGINAGVNAQMVKEHAVAFCEDFEKTAANLCLSGKTGVGKTFLTHCIAKRVMERGFGCLYVTAFEMFDLFEKNTFRHSEDSESDLEQFFETDLLIIDDLGANQNNSYICGWLFRLINERLNRRKSVVISTNLTQQELRDEYSERVSSRIMSSYERLYLFGDDIRIRKRITGGKTDEHRK